MACIHEGYLQHCLICSLFPGLKQWHIVLSYRTIDDSAFRELIIPILLDLMLFRVLLCTSRHNEYEGEALQEFMFNYKIYSYFVYIRSSTNLFLIQVKLGTSMEG